MAVRLSKSVVLFCFLIRLSFQFRFRPIDALINRVWVVVAEQCPGGSLYKFMLDNDLISSNFALSDFTYIHHCQSSPEGLTAVLAAARQSAEFRRAGGKDMFMESRYLDERSDIRLYSYSYKPEWVLFHMAGRVETDLGQWRANGTLRHTLSDPQSTLSEVATWFNLPMETVLLNDDFWTREWGYADIEQLLPAIAHVSASNGQQPAVLVDAGANVGKITKSMMEIFPDNFQIISVEPIKMNFEKLVDLAHSSDWSTSGRFFPVNAGISDQTGTLRFEYKCAGEINELARIVSDHNQHVRMGDCQSEIPVYTLTDILNSTVGLNGAQVLLLKLDLEGHDGQVIRGTLDYFARRAIKFVSFEFAQPSLADKHSLEYIVRTLWSVGYMCFWITRENLIPVSSWFFHRGFELRRWTNYFCGYYEDPDILRILRSVNTNEVVERGYQQFLQEFQQQNSQAR